MKKNFWTPAGYTLCFVLLIGLLSSCAREYRPNVYDFSQLGEEQQIYTVEILSVMPIKITNDTGTLGSTAIGAASGALVGNLVGGNSKGAGIGALAGGFIGGLVGATHKDKGVLIKYKDQHGYIQSMTQMGEVKDYKLGEATQVIAYNKHGNQEIRIMPNNLTPS